MERKIVFCVLLLHKKTIEILHLSYYPPENVLFVCNCYVKSLLMKEFQGGKSSFASITAIKIIIITIMHL